MPNGSRTSGPLWLFAVQDPSLPPPPPPPPPPPEQEEQPSSSTTTSKSIVKVWAGQLALVQASAIGVRTAFTVTVPDFASGSTSMIEALQALAGGASGSWTSLQ